jgi:hypothetical protein
MRIVRDSLILSLVVSALVGTQILVSDKWLWSAAPSHAYGLIGFVVIDLTFAILALWRIGPAAIGAAMISVTQFGAMLADNVAGQPMGVPSIAFRNYLFSDMSYIDLLLIQIAIFIIATGALTMPVIRRHFRCKEGFLFQRTKLTTEP